MDFTNWIPMLTVAVFWLMVWLARNWITARVKAGVQHTFDAKIENLRAELRTSEERLKSDLRRKETEIDTFRDRVLGGRMNRNSLLDKRRIDAVEKLWGAMIAYAPYKAVSGMMASVNLEEAFKVAPHQQNVRKFFETISAMVPSKDPPKISAKVEQPFLSPLAWAYFAAYESVILGNFMRLKMLEVGVRDAEKLIKVDAEREILKKALPHQTKFIESSDAGSYHYLLDELEALLLKELIRMLESTDLDAAEVERSSEIIRMVESAASTNEQIVRAQQAPKQAV